MKIFCVGRNYIDHAKELGNSVPDEPVIFIKPKNALLPSGMALMYPAFTNELHFECELVLKISKNGKFVSPRHAHQYFNEVTLGIDFTARDVQNKLKKNGLPWEKAKAFDHSAALGQSLPIAEIGPLHQVEFKLYKNEELVQHGKVADMIFMPSDIIADITNYFTINIGDLIYTGTPAGVGECVVGDVLEGYLNDDPILHVEIR